MSINTPSRLGPFAVVYGLSGRPIDYYDLC